MTCSNTTSAFLLNALKEKLDSNDQIISYEISRDKDNKIAHDIIQNLSDTDNIVIAYPLYLDSIPAGLLRELKYIEDNMDKNCSSIYVYQIVNNGFYDADQNSIAVDMLWQWCKECGMKKGQALVVGAGPMSQKVSIKYGFFANLGKAINNLAKDISCKIQKDTVYIEPRFPRLMYKIITHMIWKKRAKNNHLKTSDMLKRL